MPRLPQPGSDNDEWGDLLNDFLSEAHNHDGTLKPIASGAISDGAITVSKLAASTPTDGQVLSYDEPGLSWSTPSSSGLVPDASSSTKGLVQLTGDLGGTAALPRVVGLQNLPIATTTPSDNQILAFNGVAARWEPRDFGVSYLPEGWVSVKDFGAVGDGSTDDLAAFEAALAALNPLNTGSGQGVAGGVLYIPPGEYLISDTIDITRFSGVIVGNGVGNSPDWYLGAGHASIIKWGGTAGVPMVKVSDCLHIKFSQIRFQGHNANTPSAGINFYAPDTGDPAPHDSNGSGTNAEMVVEDCFFGNYTWTSGGVSQGAMTNGILVDGTGGNNDQFRLSRCTFIGNGQTGTTGVKIAATQSIWASSQNCTYNGLDAGFDTVASHTLFNANFNRCVTDVVVRSSAQVHCFGHWSENSGRLLYIAGGGTYSVSGGKWQLMPGGWTINQTASNNGYYIYAPSLGSGGFIRIDGVQLHLTGDYSSLPEAWMVYVRSSAGTGNQPAIFEMKNCTAHGDQFGSVSGGSALVGDPTRFNLGASVSSAGLKVDINNPMLRYRQHLVSGATNASTQLNQLPNVATGFFGAEPITRPILNYSRTGESQANAQLRTALSNLGLVQDDTTA